jgi:lactobin A/cerein 7B family class IIb bacteriocin
MNTAALNLVELNTAEMIDIDGGVEPISTTAVIIWIGAGLVTAAAGALVGYAIAS